uniref:Uncharacterized protein n=1 Tax=Anguilla anguilla TaxID=7936 RepID=A0A0E9QE45_ANGAN
MSVMLDSTFPKSPPLAPSVSPQSIVVYICFPKDHQQAAPPLKHKCSQ